MYNFGLRRHASSNVENHTTFRHTLQLLSSGSESAGFWQPRIGQAVGGFDGADWWKRRAGCHRCVALDYTG
jgi:hypothetical protein